MRGFSGLVWAFVRRDFFIATSYKFSFLFQLVAGIFALAIFHYMSLIMDTGSMRMTLARFQTDYFSFVLIGLAGAGFLHTGLTGFSDGLRTGMTEGSLEMTFSCPVRPVLVLLLPCIWAFSFDALKMVILIGFGSLLFGAHLENANVLGGIAVIIGMVTSYSVFGILSASIIMVLKKGDPINAAFGALATLISGAFFPTEVLPSWLGSIAKLLPMTYAYEALRKTLLLGTEISGVLPELLVLAGFSVVGLPTVIFVASLAITKSKRDGTLGIF